jgi:hypothetical protein
MINIYKTHCSVYPDTQLSRSVLLPQAIQGLLDLGNDFHKNQIREIIFQKTS